MTDAELFEFMATFMSLTRVFPLRGDDQEIRDVGASYFRALRRWSLADLRAGADVWLTKGERFPKPGQWIASIPTRKTREISIEIRSLSEAETRELFRAELKGYEDEPCSCSACHAAGVTHRYLRFVPDLDADGMEAKARSGDRVVITGHWAHGDELARWYAAKDAFYAQARARVGSMAMEKPKKLSFAKRIEQIFAERPRKPKPEAVTG